MSEISISGDPVALSRGVIAVAESGDVSISLGLEVAIGLLPDDARGLVRDAMIMLAGCDGTITLAISPQA